MPPLDDAHGLEESWRELRPSHLARSFALNAIGPAVIIKHVLPLLPRQGKSVFATLSAKLGSIGENRLGGWYSYRASKAALNQLVRTAAIELGRRHPDSICVALHPGMVDTDLTSPFNKAGLEVQSPDAAAGRLLAAVIDRLSPAPAAFWITAESAFHGDCRSGNALALINLLSRMIQRQSWRVSACAT